MNAAPAVTFYTDTPGLTCDEDHVYHFGSDTPLGVTEVMDANGFEPDPRFYLDGSAERGRFLHQMLAYAALGRYPYMPLVEEKYHGWTRSGLDFLDGLLAEGAVVLGVEVRRYHPLYQFAGTIDLVMLWRKYEWVLDYKSGKAARITRFKMGAYDALLGPTANGLPRKRAAVEIQEDGSRARLVKFNTPEHFHDGNRFLSYLTTARDRRAFGPK